MAKDALQAPNGKDPGGAESFKRVRRVPAPRFSVFNKSKNREQPIAEPVHLPISPNLKQRESTYTIKPYRRDTTPSPVDAPIDVEADEDSRSQADSSDSAAPPLVPPKTASVNIGSRPAASERLTHVASSSGSSFLTVPSGSSPASSRTGSPDPPNTSLQPFSVSPALSSSSFAASPDSDGVSPNRGFVSSPSMASIATTSSFMTPNSSQTHGTSLLPPVSPAMRSISGGKRKLAGYLSKMGNAAGFSASLKGRSPSNDDYLEPPTDLGTQPTDTAAVPSTSQSMTSNRVAPGHAVSSSVPSINVNEPAAMAYDSDPNPRASSKGFLGRSSEFVSGATAKLGASGGHISRGMSRMKGYATSPSLFSLSAHVGDGGAEQGSDRAGPAGSETGHSDTSYSNARKSSISGLGLSLSAIGPSNWHTGSTIGKSNLQRKGSRSARELLAYRSATAPAAPMLNALVFGVAITLAAARTRLATTLEEVADLGDLSPYAADSSPEADARAQRRREAYVCLPALVMRCFDYLEFYGTSEEGLYRVPGGSSEVSRVRTIFDSGADLDLLGTVSTRDMQPSAVASALKKYIMDLPTALLGDISNLEFTTLFQAAGPEAVKRFMLDRLPISNLIMLRQLAYHLAHLDAHSGKTKMTFNNFQLFFPTTLRTTPLVLDALVKQRAVIFPTAGELDIVERAKAAFAIARASVVTAEAKEVNENVPSGSSLMLALDLPSDKLEGLTGLTISSRPCSMHSSSDDASRITINGDKHDRSIKSAESSFTEYHRANKRSSILLQSRRVSTHLVDLPPRAVYDDDASSGDEAGKVAFPRMTRVDDNLPSDSWSATPIAAMFHRRSASAVDLFTRATNSAAMSSDTPGAQQASPARSSRDSPSPFFSAGALAIEREVTHRKRGSISSIRSCSSSASLRKDGGFRRSLTQATDGTLQNHAIVEQADHSVRLNGLNADNEDEMMSSSETSHSMSSASEAGATTPGDESKIDITADDFRFLYPTEVTRDISIASKRASMLV